MTGVKLIRKSTRSSARGGRAGGVGGASTKLPEGNTPRTPKRVTFSPVYAEGSDDDDSSDFTPVSVPVTSTPVGRRTPTSSSRQRVRVTVTPYPYSSKLSETPSKRQKRRRSKTSRSVFPTSKQSKDKKRPQTTLTAQLKYMMEVLPERVEELRNNTRKICHAKRNRDLAALEENLLERIAIVSGLDTKDEKEVTQDRQQEVLDMMTSSLVNLQEIVERKKSKLEDVRPGLRASFNSRYVCCPVCAEQEKKRKAGK